MGDIKGTLIILHANRGGLPVTGGQVLGDGKLDSSISYSEAHAYKREKMSY